MSRLYITDNSTNFNITGMIYGSRLIDETPISGRLVTLERSKSVAAASKTVHDFKFSGKAYHYRQRQISEPLGETIAGENKEINSADGSNENVLPIKTPPYLNTSRFKLFPRRGSKCTSIPEDNDLEESNMDITKEKEDKNFDCTKRCSSLDKDPCPNTVDKKVSEVKTQTPLHPTCNFEISRGLRCRGGQMKEF